MSRASKLASLVLLLATAHLLSGCLFGPYNGDVACGADEIVNLWGYTTTPNQTVTFEAATDPAGPYVDIGSATTLATGGTIGGATLYRFEADLPVSEWATSPTGLTTHIRARVPWGAGSARLVTFEASNASGDNGLQCVVNAIVAGETAVQATIDCQSPDSPVATVTAPHVSTCGCTPGVVVGDLVIGDAPSAAAALCTTEVTGDLRILDGAPDVVALPSLTTIGGSAELHYELPLSNGDYRSREVDLSAVTSIGGDVDVFARRGSLANKTLEAGLDAVTSVGGDIVITTDDHNVKIFGGLTSVPGDVTLEGWTGANGNLDVSGFNTLPALGSVGGDLTVQGFFAALNLFTSVTAVTGDVTLREIRMINPPLTSLSTVNGDLVFWGIKSWGPAWATSPTVGGDLWVRENTLISLTSVPIGAAAVGGFSATDNANLTDLTSTFQAGAGDVTISGSFALSQCDVDAFLAAQALGGWTGLANVTDTVPCP